MAEPEPTNLALEQLRLMRAETSAFRADVGQRLDRIETEMRGLKLQSNAEIYKANLTVASFVDLDERLRKIEGGEQ